MITLDLAEPQVLRAFLKKHGIEPKKGLGQHFLCSTKVVAAIIDAADGAQSAVEIGPGPGILTSALEDRFQHVAAIEVDRDMVPVLAESAPKTNVISANALEVDLGSILQGLPGPRAVISNLPYYITGPLITRIAAVRSTFQVAVLMMQREVADRILAGEGNSNRGSLSVFLQLQFAIRKVCDVPPGSFLPPPKVDSTVLSLTPLTEEPDVDRRLALIIRSSFRMPRKTLANNLIASGFGDRAEVESALEVLGLDSRIRPQFLANADWRRLLDHLPGHMDLADRDVSDVDLG